MREDTKEVFRAMPGAIGAFGWLAAFLVGMGIVLAIAKALGG